MAAGDELGELANNPLVSDEAEDPISKTPASVQPDKNNLGKVLASGSKTKGRGLTRERKKVEFYAPQEANPAEKLVVQEVCICKFDHRTVASYSLRIPMAVYARLQCLQLYPTCC